MSTSGTAAAPVHHPPGEAQTALGVLPLAATTIAVALAMNKESRMTQIFAMVIDAAVDA